MGSISTLEVLVVPHLFFMELERLQDLCKRDPESYKDEFLLQLKHLNGLLNILKLNPRGPIDELPKLLLFVANVAFCYPKDTVEFADLCLSLLSEEAERFEPKLRLVFARSVSMMRTRQVLAWEKTFPVFFALLGLHDKQLHSFVHGHLISDITKAKTRNDRGPFRWLQKHVSRSFLAAPSELATERTLHLILGLYDSGLWADAGCVNTIANGCVVQENLKLATRSVKFFLATDKRMDVDSDDSDSSESEDEEIDQQKVHELRRRKGINRSKKNEKKLAAALKVKKRGSRRGRQDTIGNLAAIELIHDAQSFAERLFAYVRKVKMPFETKVMYLDLVSRLVGLRKLVLLNFYPYLYRYLNTNQRDVTKILAITVQATHDQCPRDAIADLLNVLIQRFVTDYNDPEVISVGLNTVRGMVERCPESMSREIWEDIAIFKKAKDKGVSMGYQGVLHVVRDVAGHVLKRKEKGKLLAKASDSGMRRDGVPYAELLEQEEDGGSDSDSDSDDDSRASAASDGEEASAKPIDVRKILTDEDHQTLKLKKAELIAQGVLDSAGLGLKRPSDNPIDPTDLHGHSKRMKDNREERIRSQLSGRDDYHHGSSRSKRKGGGSSNARKQRTKAFGMVKHSRKVHGKSLMSAQEKTRMRLTHGRTQRMRYKAKRK